MVGEVVAVAESVVGSSVPLFRRLPAFGLEASFHRTPCGPGGVARRRGWPRRLIDTFHGRLKTCLAVRPLTAHRLACDAQFRPERSDHTTDRGPWPLDSGQVDDEHCLCGWLVHVLSACPRCTCERPRHRGGGDHQPARCG